MAETMDTASFEDAVKENSSLLLWTGIGMSLIGAAAIAFPVFSSVTANFMVGWLFIFSGAMAVIHSFTIKGTGPFFGAILVGLITLVAGIVLLANPAAGLLVLTLTIALVFVFEGAYEIAATVELYPRNGWGWMLISAVISIAAGLLIVSKLPGSSLFFLGLLIGINFLSTGISMIMLSRSGN